MRLFFGAWARPVRALAVGTVLLLGACGDDGREMAQPSPALAAIEAERQSSVPQELPELSVVVADDDQTTAPTSLDDAQTSVGAAPSTTRLSPTVSPELVALCQSYASLRALEDSRAILEVQSQSARDAAEDKRQRDLDAVEASLEASGIEVATETVLALQNLRLHPMAAAPIDDPNHARSLGVVHVAIGSACGLN